MFKIQMKLIMAVLALSLVLGGCGSNDDGTFPPVTEIPDTNDSVDINDTITNPETNVTIPDLNNTEPEDTVNISVVIPKGQESIIVKENKESLIITIRLIDGFNNPYAGGIVKMIRPDKVRDGADIGYFDAYEVTADSNGEAQFIYTAPSDLEGLVASGDTSTVFKFYYAQNQLSAKSITINYSPVADQIIDRTYTLSLGSADSSQEFSLENEELLTGSVTDEFGNKVLDENIVNITLTAMNPKVMQFRDDAQALQTALSFTKNGVKARLITSTTSGLGVIKMLAVFTDVNGVNKTMEKIFNYVVHSGPPSAISIGYKGFSDDTENNKIVEKIVVSVTDKYFNPVDTKPVISTGVLAGFAEDLGGPLQEYMYFPPNSGNTGTMDGSTFSTSLGGITNLELESSGSGYTTTPTVTITGAGSGATAQANLSSKGAISSISIQNSGSNYIQAPKISADGGVGLLATAVMNGTVTNIEVTNGGRYSSAPTVTVLNGTTAATTQVTMSEYGTITDINLTQQTGHGYEVGQVLTVYGDGTGAIVEVEEVNTTTGDGNVTLISVKVLNGGSGYSYANLSTTVVDPSDPSTIIASGGDSGTVTIKKAVDSVSVLTGGDGYSSNPPVVFTGTGAGATATATVSKYVESVTVLNGGTGYDQYSHIIFTPAEGDDTGKGAQGYVNGLTYGVENITLTNAGSNYTNPVAVNISGPATAKAYVSEGFSNLTDDKNYKLAVFGEGYTYNTSGKWDFNNLNSNALSLVDQYDGNITSKLGFAVGNNYRASRCEPGVEWLGSIKAKDGNYQLNELGTIELELSYDYYLTGKAVIVWVNLLGEQNSLDQTVRIGESRKMTLRGSGLTSVPTSYSIPKNSSGTASFAIKQSSNTEWLENSRVGFNYNASNDVAVTGISVSDPKSCNGTSGTTYVNISYVNGDSVGSISISDILVADEF